MRIEDLEAMDFEDLWLLHEELTKILVEKINAEKVELEKRLAQLGQTRRRGDIGGALAALASSHRYPKVKPKYRNPAAPQETWSGRGKQPRWLAAALKAGHTIDEFKIKETEAAPKGGKTGGV